MQPATLLLQKGLSEPTDLGQLTFSRLTARIKREKETEGRRELGRKRRGRERAVPKGTLSVRLRALQTPIDLSSFIFPSSLPSLAAAAPLIEPTGRPTEGRQEKRASTHEPDTRLHPSKNCYDCSVLAEYTTSILPTGLYCTYCCSG